MQTNNKIHKFVAQEFVTFMMFDSIAQRPGLISDDAIGVDLQQILNYRMRGFSN